MTLDEAAVERIAEDTAEKYRNYVNPGIVSVFKLMGFDVPEERAEGCYIWDVSGRKFLDCVGGYGAFSLGHRHPKVVEAVTRQLEREALKSHFLMSIELADACEALAGVLPGDINYSFLCNSGTEAVEGALKCARIHTGRTEYIGAANGFHGKSYGSLSVSGREVYKEAFKPLLPITRHVPFGDTDALANTISDNTAAVILEIVQGEAGVNIAPDDYFPRVRKLCTASGALLIIDEVRTAFGRTGQDVRLRALRHPAGHSHDGQSAGWGRDARRRVFGQCRDMGFHVRRQSIPAFHHVRRQSARVCRRKRRHQDDDRRGPGRAVSEAGGEAARRPQGRAETIPEHHQGGSRQGPACGCGVRS